MEYEEAKMEFRTTIPFVAEDGMLQPFDVVFTVAKSGNCTLPDPKTAADSDE